MPSTRQALSSLALLLPCCGGSAPAAPAPVAPSPPAASAPSSDAPVASQDPSPSPPSHLPSACSDASAPVCTPPGDFVERLCAKPLQDVALALFSKDTPFTRLYLRGRLDELTFDEEVLALRFHGQPKGGMVIGNGSGTYDVLRWDGTCARGVEADALGRTRPPRPRSANVQWHRIGSAMQDALIGGSDAVKKAHAKRGKECQGATSGDVSRSCEASNQALIDTIVDYVRSGGALPEPAVLP
jgi:hypothetical protein